MTKKVVISCGPIPARLDSVKFITNRFKGGLAFHTADQLAKHYDVTVVIWEFTQIPDLYQYWDEVDNMHIVKVKDVVEYCQWFEDHAKEYDAFIMAAAVANLMPSDPYEGKFPSHMYKVGDKFPIQFEIAPRAIDIIKKINPRACLIGYKLFDGTYDELIEAARITQVESKANIIFANTPATAKTEKFAVLADNSVIKCSFPEHLDMIRQQIDAHYFRTEVVPLTEDEENDINIRKALAVVKLYDQTFPEFGTVAVPVEGTYMFATTSRGHKGEPVIVRSIDRNSNVIQATGKATLNAPTLAALLKPGHIVVHRHFDDPFCNKYTGEPGTIETGEYLFPGTAEETDAVLNKAKKHPDADRFILKYHGDLTVKKISDPDWNLYKEQFPEKYFGTPDQMEDVISQMKTDNCLEVGCNTTSDASFAYDKYVTCENAVNLTWSKIMSRSFDMIYIRNAVNYLSRQELTDLISRCDTFIANTFISAPDEKLCENEVSVSDRSGLVYHFLRLPDDTLISHSFYAYNKKFFEELGLTVVPYSKTACIVCKGCDL